MARYAKLLPIMASLAFFIGAPAAFAEDKPMMDAAHDQMRMGDDENYEGMDVKSRLEKMKKNLNLSDEQVTKLREIFERNDAKIKPLVEKKRAAHKDIADMVRKGGFDDASLEKAAQAVGDIEAQLIVQRIKNQAEMFGVLDAKQQEKLKEWHGKGRQGAHWR